jgi:hypothetical protein
VIGVAGLALVVGLTEADPSLGSLIGDQLALDPRARLERLLPGEEAGQIVEALGAVAELGGPVIVIGPIAAALQGGPQRPRATAVEVVPNDRDELLRELKGRGAEPGDDEERFNDVNRRWHWNLSGAALVVVDRLPGAGDYPDLRRGAVELQVSGHQVKAASPRDLLRLAEASPAEADRAYVPGLRALLRRLTRPRD